MLKHRWSREILQQESACLNESVQLEIMNSKREEMDLFDTESFIAQHDIELGVKLYVILHYCPHSVQESIKLNMFYKDLLMKQNLRTVIQATMNNVLPGTSTIRDRGTIITFFNRLDGMYNFTRDITPLMAALSTSDQLKELTKLGLPFVDLYTDTINQCLNKSGCEEFFGVSRTAGNSITFIVEKECKP